MDQPNTSYHLRFWTTTEDDFEYGVVNLEAVDDDEAARAEAAKETAADPALVDAQLWFFRNSDQCNGRIDL